VSLASSSGVMRAGAFLLLHLARSAVSSYSIAPGLTGSCMNIAVGPITVLPSWPLPRRLRGGSVTIVIIAMARQLPAQGLGTAKWYQVLQDLERCGWGDNNSASLGPWHCFGPTATASDQLLSKPLNREYMPWHP